jgi:type III secretion protein D
MKQLRILTGRHAGARLRLTRNECTLGNADDLDVQITDWKGRPVVLAMEEGSNVVRISAMSGQGAAGAGRVTELENLVPRRFDDIVLCIGPEDDRAWPSDVDLLKRMLKRPRRRQESAGHRLRTTAVAGGIACTLMLAGFGVVLTDSTQQAHASVPVTPLHVQVAAALARDGLGALRVREAEGKVIVEGLVKSTSDLALARQTLRRFDEGRILHKYAAASSIAQSISDALADPALRVSYRGGGVFLIEGGVVDVDRLRTSASRIAGDIGPLVQRIDVAVAELPPPQRVHVNAMLVTDELKYVQTRDGTKHLIVSSTGPRDASAETLIHQPQ